MYFKGISSTSVDAGVVAVQAGGAIRWKGTVILDRDCG